MVLLCIADGVSYTQRMGCNMKVYIVFDCSDPNDRLIISVHKTKDTAQKALYTWANGDDYINSMEILEYELEE